MYSTDDVTVTLNEFFSFSIPGIRIWDFLDFLLSNFRRWTSEAVSFSRGTKFSVWMCGTRVLVGEHLWNEKCTQRQHLLEIEKIFEKKSVGITTCTCVTNTWSSSSMVLNLFHVTWECAAAWWKKLYVCKMFSNSVMQCSGI